MKRQPQGLVDLSMSRPRMSRRSVLAAAGSLAATAVIGASAARAAATTIRYATAGGIGPSEPQTVVFSPAMQKTGVLKSYGSVYTVDFVSTRNAAEATALLAAEQADIASAGFVNILAAVRKDIVPGGISVIADLFQDGKPGWASNTFFARSDSAIKTVADLKGKVIGVVGFGTPLDMALQVVLKKAGLDPKKDVQVVEVSFPNMGPALREKRIDCGSFINPFMANEKAKGGLHPVFNYGDAFGNLSVVCQAARKKFLAANGAVVKAYLADYVAGLQWLYANQPEAVKIAEQIAKAQPGAMSYFATKDDYYRAETACIGAEQLQRPIDAVIKAGIFDGAFDAAKVIDTSYLPASCNT
ncbi:ABC transporter substrate-binding protein [Tardiphaga sp.]|jgi:sulfonate transport system substrate-binding protein|uniref:ABC transporter substrate-binding protein n=1 Tax=Tardiphaga sp. TaxID=1926292 RepID=UPI0037DA3F5B